MFAKLIVIGWTLLIGYALLKGLADTAALNPSDTVMGLAIAFSAITHLALWLLVALPTYMISRMFRRQPSA